MCCAASVSGGKFCVQLPAMEASDGLTLKISAADPAGQTEIFEIRDVAVGEVDRGGAVKYGISGQKYSGM